MTEKIEILYEKLSFCYETRKFADLRIILLDMEPYDIAQFIDDNLDEKERIVFFRLLPKELASDVFVEFDSDTQEIIIKAFTDKELKALIDDMFLDDTVDIIEEMPANVVKRILNSSDADDRKTINKLLEYPDDSAGSIMTTEYVSFSASTTVKEAFEKIRKTGLNKETIYTCYVTDRKRKLIGVVTVKDMLLAEPNELIANIMETGVITLETHEDKEQAALKFSNYDYLALPVIDKEGCLVGIVTVDDAVDVIQEEATEDIQKMAAVLPNEKPYFKQSIFSIFKSRVPWLLLLMISATFTSMVLTGYETKLQAIAGGVLYSFVPMLMGTAGNAGNQTSVTIIRALAVGDVELKDVFKVILKELAVAFSVGLVIAVVCFLKLYFIDSLYSEITFEIALIVSAVLLFAIVMAKLVGCLLPLIAKRVKLDPAVVASPFMTTIVDVLSLIIYCSICIAIL